MYTSGSFSGLKVHESPGSSHTCCHCASGPEQREHLQAVCRGLVFSRTLNLSLCLFFISRTLLVSLILFSLFLSLSLSFSLFLSFLILFLLYHITPVLIQKWRDHFTVDKMLLLGMLGSVGTTAKSRVERLAGLSLLAALLTNGVAPFDPDVDVGVSEFRFLDELVNNLTYRYKEVYCAAAEVCGIALHSLHKQLRSTETQSQSRSQTETGSGSGSGSGSETLSEAVRESVLCKLLYTRVLDLYARDDYSRMLNCLERIGKFHSGFLGRDLFVRLFNMLPMLLGEFKVIALNLVRLRCTHIEEVWKQLQPVVLSDLSRRDENTQEVGLCMCM
jgi:DNA-dependent protein kinase catalytic subunit